MVGACHASFSPPVAELSSSAISGPCQTPPDDLPGATLAEADFAPNLGRRLDAGAHDGRFAKLRAGVVLRGGMLVLER